MKLFVMYAKNMVKNAYQIITFGTLAKTLIRDLGRVLEIDLSYCDKLAKMIPETLKTIQLKSFL